MKEKMFPRIHTRKTKKFGKTGNAERQLNELENRNPVTVEIENICREDAAPEGTRNLIGAFSLQNFKKVIFNK